MKRVLIVKTSSLGDVVHTLPALTDARRALPGIRFDWLVEEAFADIPARHPAVERVIPVAWRRWRRSPLRAWRSGEWVAFRRELKREKYDLVIDAQGLIKSAFFTRMARGTKAGLARDAAREPLASAVLDVRISVPKQKHAIERVRELFARALDYPSPVGAADAGLPRARPPRGLDRGRVIFFHGTTWPTKHWPEPYWRELAVLVTGAGNEVLLPWGNDAERERAERLARDLPGATVLPRMSLRELLDRILELDAFVAVDTGLAHLAAAAGLPGVALYGPTDPALTGVTGPRAVSLVADFSCAPCRQETCSRPDGQAVQPPCFTSLPAARVWQRLREVAAP